MLGLGLANTDGRDSPGREQRPQRAGAAADPSASTGSIATVRRDVIAGIARR